MSKRTYDLNFLLDGVSRLVPGNLIIDYKFIKNTNLDITISVWATTNNLGLVCLGKQVLFKPSVITQLNTDILKLYENVVTGLWVEIENFECIEIQRMSYDIRKADKLIGREMYNYTDPLEIVSIVTDNLNPFVVLPYTYLKTVVKGTPTFYMISSESDYVGAEWVAYTNRFLYSGLKDGYNKLYYKVMNAEFEVDESFIEIEFVVNEPLAWSDEGEFAFFYLRFTESIIMPELSVFNTSVSLISGMNGNKLTITSIEYYDNRTMKVYCNLTNQIAGMTIVNGQFSAIQYSNGAFVEYFAVQFFLPKTPYPVIAISDTGLMSGSIVGSSTHTFVTFNIISEAKVETITLEDFTSEEVFEYSVYES